MTVVPVPAMMFWMSSVVPLEVSVPLGKVMTETLFVPTGTSCEMSRLVEPPSLVMVMVCVMVSVLVMALGWWWYWHWHWYLYLYW